MSFCSRNNQVTGIAFSNDGIIFVSRNSHDSLCIWDMRNVSHPLKTLAGLPNKYSNTNVVFSPDEDFIVTGTSSFGVKSSINKFGSICFIDRKRLETSLSLSVGGSAIQLAWHPKLNQILVTGGDHNGGYVKIFYDPSKSRKGAISFKNKVLSIIKQEEWRAPLNVVNLFASNEGLQRVSKKKNS
jgi:WD40 repeat protein